MEATTLNRLWLAGAFLALQALDIVTSNATGANTYQKQLVVGVAVAILGSGWWIAAAGAALAWSKALVACVVAFAVVKIPSWPGWGLAFLLSVTAAACVSNLMLIAGRVP